MDQKYAVDEERIKELENIYTYHAPINDQQDRYIFIREVAKHLAATIEQSCPPSREKALAHALLEQAVMWANASIARNEK